MGSLVSLLHLYYPIPKPFRQKLAFLIIGVAGFQLLNISRLILIALYWKPATLIFKMNAHDIFNLVIYVVISVSIYYWLKLTKPDNR